MSTNCNLLNQEVAASALQLPNPWIQSGQKSYLVRVLVPNPGRNVWLVPLPHSQSYPLVSSPDDLYQFLTVEDMCMSHISFGFSHLHGLFLLLIFTAEWPKGLWRHRHSQNIVLDNFSWKLRSPQFQGWVSACCWSYKYMLCDFRIIHICISRCFVLYNVYTWMIFIIQMIS